MIARPTVDLPHPDSPTRPSVSPRPIESVTPSTALTSPTWRSRTSPLLIGNQTRSSSTLDEHVAHATPSRARCHASAGTGLTHRASWPVLHRAERRHVVQALVDHVAAARRERTRGGRAEHVARRAFDRLELRATCRVETRNALQQAERVRMARSREQILGASRSPTNMPAYMTCTRSHMPATTPRSCVIRIERRVAARRRASGEARGSAPGS